MGHGGTRPKAGRKPGGKNRLEKTLADAVAPQAVEAVTAGITPLEHFLKVMRDEKKDDSLRLEAARAAAPYVHKRMPQDVNHDHTHGPIAVRIITPRTRAASTDGNPAE